MDVHVLYLTQLQQGVSHIWDSLVSGQCKGYLNAFDLKFVKTYKKQPNRLNIRQFLLYG